MQRSQVRQRWRAGQLKGSCTSPARSKLHDAKTLEALFTAAGVEVRPTPGGPPQLKLQIINHRTCCQDWDASLTENGLDSVKLTQLIKVHTPDPGTRSPEI